MAKKQKRRSACISLPGRTELRRSRVRVWGYDQSQKFVCRMEITSAGVELYAGTKGGKQIANVNWEGLVERLAD